LIDRFNPASAFHLSLGIDYPRESERLRAAEAGRNPGGDIFIHGSEVTIGCIPIGDDKIEEVYVIAVDARDAGQERIPVEILPCRFGSERCESALREQASQHVGLAEHWQRLRNDVYQRAMTGAAARRESLARRLESARDEEERRRVFRDASAELTTLASSCLSGSGPAGTSTGPLRGRDTVVSPAAILSPRCSAMPACTWTASGWPSCHRSL